MDSLIAFILGLIDIAWRPLLMWTLLLSLVPVMIWLERKGSAYIQDRVGPNRAHIFGIRLAGVVHNLSDVVKLVTKEDIIPSSADRKYFLAAPFIAMTVALMTYAVIPFADTVVIGEKIIPMQAVDLSVGFLYIFAISSLAVYAVVLAGWSSNSKYSLLGGLRSSAQMISYEVSLGLSIIGIVMIFGTVRLNEIVQGQGQLFDLLPLPMWGIVIQPLGFILYTVCAFAETNRNPFDLPEGESEIVAGYHVEYSSMKFALFFMAEYCNILIQAAIITTLFLGGWQIPWLPTEALKGNVNVVVPVICGLKAVLLVGMALLMARYHQVNRHAWTDARKKEGLYLGVACAAGALVAAVFCLVFIFGWQPGQTEAGAAIFTALIQFGVFVLKTLAVAWVFIWIRWTLPRFRYDQLMKLGWQVMLPLGLVNLLLTAFVMMCLQVGSIRNSLLF